MECDPEIHLISLEGKHHNLASGVTPGGVGLEGCFKMKYNAMGSSNLSCEGKKSTLTIYADLDIADRTKESAMESEVSQLKEELLQAQTALDKQTKRCRQLVGEFTRTLQEKESLYKYEKNLRDDQLAKVLRALLLVEARLKQEQKLLTRQLKEKDFIIQKQNYDIQKLLSSQYCKSCSQYYNYGPNAESLDSSSEYIITEYQESNFGSLDSSSEMCTALWDKDSSSTKSNDLGSNETKSSDSSDKSHYVKNKGKDSLERRMKKFPHRKSIGTYFEVLKLRSDTASPYSNEDNTSNDYDNFDSLPTESVTDRMSVVSRESDTSYQYESLEKIDTVSSNDNDFDAANNVSLSESNITVIHNNRLDKFDETIDEKEEEKFTESKLSDSIHVFDEDVDSNDKWYVSASDHEDETHKNIYKNNPVLECVNQILLQNINDNNSPPKTPNLERKSTKNKKVKFCDKEILINEDDQTEIKLEENENHDYYETPIQKIPNFYETPQSIYSNDYEQILSKCNETFSGSTNISEKNKNVNKKNKISRIPPALPPKPTNLLSRYKITQDSHKVPTDKSSDTISLESEPDYCSISELNLPVNRSNSQRLKVVAEINTAPKNKEISESNHEEEKMIMKTIDKIDIQVAKQTSIGVEESNSKPTDKLCQEIPKLPLVSEIIIPEETDVKPKEIISQDNYVKNNTQILKTRHNTPNRRPLSMGSSVSSLIIGFNNMELMQEINQSFTKTSPRKKTFSSTENLLNPTSKTENHNRTTQDFNLIQNFEEFKLDDCELEEYIVNISDYDKNEKNSQSSNDRLTDAAQSGNQVLIPTLNRKSLELLKEHLQKQKVEVVPQNLDAESQIRNNEPTYEHFLECTGLSSKSILTPSRISGSHKTVLKPKDIKLRSTVRTTGSSNVKYWTEPFI